MPFHGSNKDTYSPHRQKFGITVCILLLLTLGTHSLSAEESGTEEITAGELMFSNIALFNYYAERKAANKPAASMGIWDAILEYYETLAERLETTEDESYIKVKVWFDEKRGQSLADVSFHLTRAPGTRVENLDLSSYSPLFNKGHLPQTLRVSFTGSHRVAMTKPRLPPSERTENLDRQFYRLDRFDVFANAYGYAGADQAPYREVPGYFLHFPEGFIQQHLVLSSLQFAADIGTISYNFTEKWTVNGASGYKPKWPRAGSTYITYEEMNTGSFTAAPETDINFSASFGISHENGKGSLRLEMHSKNPNDVRATVMNMTGSIEFPHLELGTGLPLSYVTLTFDEAADIAKLQGKVLRSRRAPLDFPGTDISTKEYPQLAQTFDLTGLYNFSTQFFDGMASDVPVRFYAPLGLSRATMVSSRHATCNDSGVRVRAAADLQAETLGYLQRDDRLEVRARSASKMQIGDMNDYWYQVRRVSDRLIGWSYGYFLDLEK